MTNGEMMAFPVADHRGDCAHDSIGLTKREYAAIHLQAAFIAHFGGQFDKGDWHAEEATNAADALITALNQHP